MSTPAQTAANQANAKKSTGPKTEAGVAASSTNNFRHGLCGTFLIQPWEEAAKFDLLRNGLLDEHQPSTPTEQILVERMAQHHWLSQRAIRFQELCFNTQLPECLSHEEKPLALYIRYQTTHENAFRKCLADLLKLRNQAHKHQIGFESQNRKLSAEFRRRTEESRKQELHDLRLQALRSKLHVSETPEKTRPVPATGPAPAPAERTSASRTPNPPMKEVA